MFTSVTDTQTATLTRLQKVIQSEVDDFACKGVIPASHLAGKDLVLFFEDVKAGSLHKLSVVDMANEALGSLFAAAQSSGFGRGQEEVHDVSYRKAKELKPPHFALNADLLGASDVLAILQEYLLKDQALYAKPNKLNVYSEGGFFKAHRDTPKSTNHVGTITFCLPSRFTGGELVIRHNGYTLTCNWAEDVLKDDGAVAWAFLFSDCEHEVLPVTSGTRLTVAYDVYVSIEDSEPTMSTFDARTNEVTEALKSTLALDGLNATADYLGIALSHAYPVEDLDRTNGPCEDALKGVDAMLVEALKALGVKWRFIAVHDHDFWEDSLADHEPEIPRTSAGDRQFRRCIPVSKEVHCWDGWNEQYYDSPQPDRSSEDTLWVQMPQAYPVVSGYIAYGNEPCAETMYSTWAIRVTIPEPMTDDVQKSSKRKSDQISDVSEASQVV